MPIFAAGFLVATAVVSGWAVISLARSRRFMASGLVLTATVLLCLFGFPAIETQSIVSTSSVASVHSPFYYLHALIFLCLFLTLYPAINRSVWRERVRMLVLFGCVALAVFFANPILEGLGLPTTVLVAAFAIAMMAAYTIGTLATSNYKSKKRESRCGVRHAVWGAVAVSHLLLYPAIGIVFFLPSTCSDPVLTVVLCTVSLLLASVAAMWIRSEGDYWNRLEKKPKSFAQSSSHFYAALTHTSRRILI